jgi:hypothetical protein
MLGDEMGLGESVETLAVMLCHLHVEGDISSSYVSAQRPGQLDSRDQAAQRVAVRPAARPRPYHRVDRLSMNVENSGGGRRRGADS